MTASFENSIKSTRKTPDLDFLLPSNRQFIRRTTELCFSWLITIDFALEFNFHNLVRRPVQQKTWGAIIKRIRVFFEVGNLSRHLHSFCTPYDWKQYPFLPFAITHNSRLGGLLSMASGRRERGTINTWTQRHMHIYSSWILRTLTLWCTHAQVHHVTSAVEIDWRSVRCFQPKDDFVPRIFTYVCRP